MTDQTSIRDMLFYKSIFYITGVNAKIAASNSFTIVKRASAVWKLQPRVRFPLARHLFLSICYTEYLNMKINYHIA